MLKALIPRKAHYGYMVLRNFGLPLALAAVGLASCRTVEDSRMVYNEFESPVRIRRVLDGVIEGLEKSELEGSLSEGVYYSVMPEESSSLLELQSLLGSRNAVSFNLTNSISLNRNPRTQEVLDEISQNSEGDVEDDSKRLIVKLLSAQVPLIGRDLRGLADFSYDIVDYARGLKGDVEDYFREYTGIRWKTHIGGGGRDIGVRAEKKANLFGMRGKFFAEFSKDALDDYVTDSPSPDDVTYANSIDYVLTPEDFDGTSFTLGYEVDF